MRSTGETGKAGEAYAARYLEQHGWRILARNFRVRQGEIDLIAANDRFVAFVEVKTRASDRFAAARESVTPAKQRRLIATAELWIARHDTGLQPRFDVIEVYWRTGAPQPTALHHLENAFEA